MRCAAILGVLDEHALRPIEQYLTNKMGENWMGIATEAACGGYVTPVMDDIHPLFATTGRRWQLYSTQWVGPHLDDSAHEYTIGVVLSGSHWLFTGRGRKVGALERGTVYVLHNRSLHGASRRMNSDAPLIFAFADYWASDMRHAHDMAVEWYGQLIQGSNQ